MTMPLQTQNETDLKAVQKITRDYFDGLHRGDVALLQTIFEKQAHLQAPGVRLSRDEWLAAVADRPTPEGLGHSFDFQLLAVDIVGKQALVKADSPLLGKHYIDYLSLLKENDEWRIVNKMYAEASLTIP